jgi:hypothetical protein
LNNINKNNKRLKRRKEWRTNRKKGNFQRKNIDKNKIKRKFKKFWIKPNLMSK